MLDENGGLQSYVRLPSTGGTRTKGSTQVVDIFGNSDALIGRWTNGTISIPNTFTFNENQGLHYLLTRPVQPDFALPANGRIDYYQIAATRPTIADGSVAPGVFDAQMAILLGTEAKLALEGTITMPTGADPYVFSFSTAGGIEDPSQSTNIVGLTTLGTFSAFVAATDNGGTCGSIDSCGLSLTAGFAGDINTVGLTYRAVREGFGQNLAGAAIFQSGPERTSGNNGGDTGGGASFAQTLQNTAIFHSSPLFITSGSAATTAVDQNGRITGFFDANGAAISLGDSVGVTASKPGEVKESGRVGDIMAWTSYRDPADTLGPNHTSHYIAGVTSFDRPTTGVVNYALIGGTAPTNAALANGTSGYFTGQLSVAFGSTPRLGLTAEVFSNGDGYRFGTAGGAADPTNGGLSISTFGKFDGFFDATPISGNACNGAGNCIASINGNMFGANYSHAGMAYAVRDGDITLRGTAAFAANGTAIPGVGNSGAISAGGSQSVASVAPSISSIGGSDWSRWTGGPGANPPAIGSIDANITFDPVAELRQSVAGTEGRPATAAQRDWAIDQVERIMGGMITFGGETPVER